MRTNPIASNADAPDAFGGAGLVPLDTMYIETAKPVFEDMRQIVNQLSGLLLVSQ
jgi:hypothetical protein